MLALLGLLAVLFVASYCFIWRPHSDPLPGRTGQASAGSAQAGGPRTGPPGPPLSATVRAAGDAWVAPIGEGTRAPGHSPDRSQEPLGTALGRAQLDSRS